MYYLFLLMIYVSHCRSDAEIVTYNSNRYCFRFTWLGLATDNDLLSSKNCSVLKDIPCVLPLYYSSIPPTLNEMWENRSAITCSLQPGHVCIKYTYVYNNAVINITRFCGKMTEDTKTAISDGCYSQQIDGHTVEACACDKSISSFICNSSSQFKFTNAIVIFTILIFLNTR